MSDPIFNAKLDLSIVNMYLSQIRTMSKEINKKYFDMSVEFNCENSEIDIDKEGFDFKFSNFDPDENYIRIEYKYKNGDEVHDCDDYISVEDFIKYAKLK